MADDLDALGALEAQLWAEAAAASDRLRSADAALDGLERTTWGGVVDDWHEAVEAVAAWSWAGRA